MHFSAIKSHLSSDHCVINKSLRLLIQQIPIHILDLVLTLFVDLLFVLLINLTIEHLPENSDVHLDVAVLRFGWVSGALTFLLVRVVGAGKVFVITEHGVAIGDNHLELVALDRVLGAAQHNVLDLGWVNAHG